MGLNIVLKEYELGEYVKALATSDFDIARMNTDSFVDDPGPYFSMFTKDSAYNYGRFYNYEFESGVKNAKMPPPSKERDEMNVLAENAMFLERAFGCIPLCQRVNKLMADGQTLDFCYCACGLYLFF